MGADDRMPPTYRILTGLGHDDRIELHVLARAYFAAWVILHGAPPQGRHWLKKLGVELVYGEPTSPSKIPAG